MPHTDLITDLESAAEGSRELSNRCLLAVGWTYSAHGSALLDSPDGRSWDDLPDPTRNVQDAIDWMVPEGWHVDCMTTPDTDCHILSQSRMARVLLRPNLNNDAGWVKGLQSSACTSPAFALCAASLRAMKETSDG